MSALRGKSVSAHIKMLCISKIHVENNACLCFDTHLVTSPTSLEHPLILVH